MNKPKNIRWLYILIILQPLIFAILIYLIGFFNIYNQKNLPKHYFNDEEYYNVESDIKQDSIKNSDEQKFLDSVIISSFKPDPRCKGRKITISIIGVDTRLGSGSTHADANHVLNIWLDSGIVEIISIPRGTYVELGFEENDTMNLNYLANVRSTRGRVRYLEEVGKISGAGKIKYFVEFGFSQAIGLLELFGFKGESHKLLRVLRSRMAFRIGDYQRCYNQGQFIGQVILRNFKQLDGLIGKLLLRGALALVETNINYETAQNIINTLSKKNFPRSRGDVIIRLKPAMKANFTDINFADTLTLDSIYKRINRTANNLPDSLIRGSFNIVKKLKKLAAQARSKLQRSPNAAISLLAKPFEQKAWYQITDTAERRAIRNEMLDILTKAYFQTNRNASAYNIKKIIELEDSTGHY